MRLTSVLYQAYYVGTAENMSSRRCQSLILNMACI